MPGRVQVQLLGGFGNQLHQYCAARAYAESVGATLEVPPAWLGAIAFGLTDPPYSGDLPPLNDGNCGGDPALSIISQWGRIDVRLGGYFQTQNWIQLLSRNRLKSWLQVRPEYLARCGRLQRYYVAAHMRQGDYINHPLYANLTRECYAKACEEHGLPLDKLVWVEQDKAAPFDQPISFLADFITCMHADVLLRANSSFSWWAGALSRGDVYSPVVEANVGHYDARFVKGNWPRIADTNRVGVCVDDLHLPD